MKIALCGYMGSGKSTVGKSIANQLNRSFVDLDNCISAEEDRSVAAIFEEKGEIYFRHKESEILKKMVKDKANIVLALGGGTPCYGQNLSVLKEAGVQVVYLKLSVDALTERLFLEKDSRPLIAHYREKSELKDFVRKHLFERGHVYEQSDIVIDAIGKTPAEIAKELTALLD